MAEPVPDQSSASIESKNPVNRWWHRRQVRIAALSRELSLEDGPYFSSGLPYIALLILGLAGLFAGAFLTYRHILIASTSGNVAQSALCRASGHINCDAILRTDYAVIFGYFPSAVLGLMGFVFVLWLVMNGLVNQRTRKIGWAALLLYFVAAMVFSGYYAYVMMFDVDIICPWCIVVHVVNLISLIIVIVVAIKNRRKFLLPEISSRAERFYLVFGGLLLSVLVFLGSALWEKSLSFADVKEQYETVINDPAVIQAVIQGSPDYEIPITSGDPVYGAAGAPHPIILFSDFKCPVCARSEQFLKTLVDKNPGVLKLVYLNYPLERECNAVILGDLHPGACSVARAAYSAYLLGGNKAFWAYGALLFDSQKKLKPKMLTRFAEQLHLDLKKFSHLMSSDSIAAQKVKQDVQAGVDLGISATPQLFFEGKRIPEMFQGRFLVQAMQSLMASRDPEKKNIKLNW
jgi:uncharacterized membrane protein/protein-disulfide isomerase